MSDNSYCLKCKKSVELTNVEIKETKNKRRYMQGNCSVCNCKCNKFLKKEKSEIAEKVESLLKEKER
jgi:hypothetical protein